MFAGTNTAEFGTTPLVTVSVSVNTALLVQLLLEYTL